MPLPGNLTQIRIGCDQWLDFAGNPLTGKTLTLTPARSRFTDGGAFAVIYGVAITATVNDSGVAWVVVPATDDPDISPDFWNYGVVEPGGATYWIIAPSTAPVDGATGYPTINLSTVVAAPGPATGVAQVFQGESGIDVLSGTTAPSNSDGVDTQIYIDYTHGKLYAKVSGAWNTGLSLTGGGGGVTSVNTKTGVVTLTASDVGAVDTSVVGAHGGIATLDAGGNVPLAQLGNAPSGGTGAVSSVNGHTGVVVLNTADVGAVAVGDSRLTDARVPTAVNFTSRPINVRNTGNTLADAIMDGSSHLLSTRFASLAAAQAVFPTCTALTEEIDYYAIQTAINNNPKVYLSRGKAVLHKSLLLLAGGNQELEGEGPGITTLFLKSGSNSNVISPADQTNANPNVTLRRFTVDGNKAGNTGTIGQTDNILLTRCDNLTVADIESMNANGRGIHHHGLTGSVVQPQTFRDIYVHDNLHWGLHNSNGVRQVDYKNIKAINNGLRTDISLAQTGSGADNFTGGFLLDHSEVTGDGIQCHSNGQDGLWIRNAFACNLTNVWTTRNGRHGIRVLGLVDSVDDNWCSQGNGTNNALVGQDIWMDGTGNLNYGVTKHTKLTNVLAGPNQGAGAANQGFWSGNEAWAVYFDDNMAASDLNASFKVYAGTAGTIRYPSTGLGSLQINDGSGLERVELFPASGTAIQLGGVNTGQMKRIFLTANCDITLPPAAVGQVITCNLIQPTTGGPFTPTFHPFDGVAGHMKYAGGNVVPTWTTASGSADRISWLSDDGIHQAGFLEGQNI